IERRLLIEAGRRLHDVSLGHGPIAATSAAQDYPPRGRLHVRASYWPPARVSIPFRGVRRQRSGGPLPQPRGRPLPRPLPAAAERGVHLSPPPHCDERVGGGASCGRGEGPNVTT